MSVKKQATARTKDGLLIRLEGLHSSEIALGTSEEWLISTAALGGWKLVGVLPKNEERLLVFDYVGISEKIDVLIGCYQNGALAQLWSTIDQKELRSSFEGGRSMEAPFFLMKGGWQQVATIEGRGYYLRNRKATKPRVRFSEHPEKYV